jgi:nitric oxide reductase large subunit
MNVNESTTDRVVRAGIAVTAASVGTVVGGVLNPVGVALYGVAGVAALTAVTGHCPLYSMLGISTLPKAEQG